MTTPIDAYSALNPSQFRHVRKLVIENGFATVSSIPGLLTHAQ
jgi:hypothetical protein